VVATGITEAAAQLWADGACVVRRAVDGPTLDRIRAAVDALAATPELADLGAMAGDRSPGRFVAGVDHWRTHPEFVAFATRGAIPEAAAAVLGTARLWLYEDSVLVKEPGSPVPTRWHTDDGYFHVEGRRLATVWVALDPSPRSAGALRFVRGSHRDDRRYRPTLFVTDDPIPGTEGEPVPAVDADDPRVFGWDLAPGDLTVHHVRTLHAAGGNAGATPRRALSVRYCGDDAVVRVKLGAPGKPGFDRIAPGTPLVEAAGVLGLPEAVLTGAG
jgi:ectoine hydroxylase-related dioxygenase (phytanoyl-CoA dioxygenase family)